MIFEATPRDYEGVERLHYEIQHWLGPDQVAKIQCFNKAEADWIRERLLARGVPSERFFMSWLVWSSSGDLTSG